MSLQKEVLDYLVQKNYVKKKNNINKVVDGLSRRRQQTVKGFN